MGDRGGDLRPSLRGAEINTSVPSIYDNDGRLGEAGRSPLAAGFVSGSGLQSPPPWVHMPGPPHGHGRGMVGCSNARAREKYTNLRLS